MKWQLLLLLGVVLTAPAVLGQTGESKRLVCYYDSTSFTREGLGKLLNSDLEPALQFCTHLIYGYAGIRSNTYQVFSLNDHIDVHNHQFSEITSMKRKFPHLKVLLSVGGDKDIDPEHPDKYIEMLEGGPVKQTAFINTAYSMVRTYGFDGLDLAYQFPKNKPRKVHNEIGMVWKKFKKIFTGDFIVDPKANEHKEQFTAFLRDLKNAFRPDGLMLSLTVLPNVNSSWYFDVPALEDKLDFVNLAAFDFYTPLRNPKEADYSSAIYGPSERDGLGHLNIDFQVKHWLTQQFPARKINLGIATYGRAWKMSVDSGTDGYPIVHDTDGAAPEGLQSQTIGLLSWPEICAKLPNPANQYLKGADAPLRRVNDPTKRFGVYAFRPADANGEHGIWVSYDDPESASNKAVYVQANNLGGVALYDLSYDDFRGLCIGEKYPMLRSIKFRL